MKKKIGTMFKELKGNTILCIFLGCLIVAAGVIFIIFLLDINNIPTSNGWVEPGDSKSWLGHLVEYAGAVVGAFLGSIATLWAVRLTIDSQEKSRLEDNARNVLPLLSIEEWTGNNGLSLESHDFGKGNAWVRLCFTLKNVGQREMYDVKMGRYYIRSTNMKNIKKEICPVLYKNGCKNFEYFLSLQLPCCDERRFDLVVEIMFRDCYDNQYCQKIKCSCYRRGAQGAFGVDKYEVYSAPQAV